MSAVPTEIIARAVIIRDGRLLAARQRSKSWHFLPGGHIETGEPALTRELLEELGASVTVTGFVGVVEHAYTEDGVRHHEFNVVFTATIATEQVHSREGATPAWRRPAGPSGPAAVRRRRNRPPAR